jgi:uncharacterized protein YoxC
LVVELDLSCVALVFLVVILYSHHRHRMVVVDNVVGMVEDMVEDMVVVDNKTFFLIDY